MTRIIIRLFSISIVLLSYMTVPAAAQNLASASNTQVQKTNTDMDKKVNSIAFYLHDGIEILDFAGPLEVFTVADFEVVTVGLSKEPIVSQGVVTIIPEYSLADCPETDMIVVFGGNGLNASKEEKVLNWLKERAPETEVLYSVCTGAFFYARAGLLDGKRATTFHTAIDELRALVPTLTVLDDVKVVDNGQIVCAAGVSSGIDGALYLVERLKGKKAAQRVAEYIEWK